MKQLTDSFTLITGIIAKRDECTTIKGSLAFDIDVESLLRIEGTYSDADVAMLIGARVIELMKKSVQIK